MEVQIMDIEELFCIVFSSIVGLIIFVGLWRWGSYVKYIIISSDNPYGYYGRTVVCYCIGDDTRSPYKEILWKDPIWKENDRLNWKIADSIPDDKTIDIWSPEYLSAPYPVAGRLVEAYWRYILFERSDWDIV